MREFPDGVYTLTFPAVQISSFTNRGSQSSWMAVSGMVVAHAATFQRQTAHFGKPRSNAISSGPRNGTGYFGRRGLRPFTSGSVA